MLPELSSWESTVAVPGAELDLDITQLQTGNILVSWTDTKSGTVVGQIFDQLGQPISSVLPLTDLEPGKQRDASISGTFDGGFINSYIFDDGFNEELHLNFFADDGSIIARHVASDFGATNIITHEIAASLSGTALWAMAVERSGTFSVEFEGVDLDKQDSPGDPLTINFLGDALQGQDLYLEALDGRSNSYVVVAVTIDNLGGEIVRRISYAVVSTDDAANEEKVDFGPVVIDSGTAVNANSLGSFSVDVIPDGKGGFIIAWIDDDSQGTNPRVVEYARYDNSGAQVGSTMSIDIGSDALETDVNLIQMPDGFVISFDYGGDRFAQRFDDNGAAASSFFRMPDGAASVLLDDGRAALFNLDGLDIVDGRTNGTRNDLTGDTIGTTGNDVLSGFNNNTVYGWDGNDTITQGTGRVLLGGDGNDTITFTARAGSRADGEGGIDTLVLGTLTGTWQLEMATGVATYDFLTNFNLRNFENLIGSDAQDIITGTSGNNVISTGGGTDEVVGSAGADTLDGGADRDTLNYQNFFLGAIILDLTGAASGGAIAGTTAVNFERIFATNFDDTVIGSSLSETIFGGSGDDTLNGNDGDDELFGGNGDNTLNGGDGNDLLGGGTGADIIDGGDGIDTVTYAGSLEAVNVFLFSASGSTGGSAEGDTIMGIENIIGSRFNDVLYGRQGVNEINGGEGDDAIWGGDGADILDGGVGIDTLLYVGSYSGAIVNLATGFTAGAAVGDVISNFENITGGNFDDDFTGDAGDNIFIGGLGADALDGGSGLDLASYITANSGVQASLFLGGGQTGEAAGDTFTNIEGLIGSAFNDILVGRDGATDYLYGGDGTDGLRGNGGDDFLFGEDGDDLLFSGFGADHHDGGDGVDTMLFNTANAGIIVNLLAGTGSLGHAAGDTYTSIENVIGSAFGDFIIGDAGVNVLQGRAGNDTLEGRGGDDMLIGGNGADTLRGGDGFDTASYADQTAGVTASLFTGTATGGDTLEGIERLIGSSFDDILVGRDGASDTLEGSAGNDALRGNGGDDIMLGGDGNDLFFSGFGADSHDGGAGVDTVAYNQANAGLIVRLDIGQGFFNQAEGDTYTGIENVVGTAFRDALTGDSVANRLEGRAGNDDLFGLAGSDTLLGGNGNDKLDGGTGFDVLTGGLGMDTFVFQAGYQADRITDFTNGDDVLDLTAFGFSNFSQVSALASQQGNDTVINFGNGDAIRLVDFDVADFDANDVMI